jgi:hypothetical protein
MLTCSTTFRLGELRMIAFPHPELLSIFYLKFKIEIFVHKNFVAHEKYGWKLLESKSFLKIAAALNRLPDNLLNFASMPEAEGH